MPTEKGSNISRRKFIDTSVAGSVALGLTSNMMALQGCESEEKMVRGACHHDCPDTCSWIVTTKDGQITKFEADTGHPYTLGKLCAKMNYFPQDTTYHPDRLLYPMKRVGAKGESKFERVSWEEALNGIKSNLDETISRYGPESILPYSFAGTEGKVQIDCISSRFFATIGASQLDRTICGSAAYSGVSATQGAAIGMLPEDIQFSKYIIIWGSNPVITNQHLLPFIKRARQNGAKLVVIDPSSTRSAQMADWHIQPIPGTDAALALGLMNVIIEEGLYDKEYVELYTLGFDDLKKRVQEYDLAKVSQITDVSTEDLKLLAREYAQADPACIRLLIGMEHHQNGSSMFRTISCLPSLVGAWKKQGGGLLHFTSDLFGACLNWYDYDIPNKLNLNTTRKINMVELGKALNQLDPPVISLFVYNSNPAVIAPNQSLVHEGLKRDDLFTVVIDHFITDTARYADYVLPATTQLEHWDLMTSWGQHYLNLNQPAIEPRGESKPNSEIFRMLSKVMGRNEDYLYETDIEIIKTMLQSDHPYMEGITFERLNQDGWAALNVPKPFLPYANGNFPTESGKCEFYCQSLEKEGMDPLPAYNTIRYADDSEKYPLQLLTAKYVNHFLNTSHANVYHDKGRNAAFFLQMNPGDAKDRGINSGDLVKLFNDRGSLEMEVKITERNRRGLVTVPHGFWPTAMGQEFSANLLTPDGLSDRGGGSDFHDARVQVLPVNA